MLPLAVRVRVLPLAALGVLTACSDPESPLATEPSAVVCEPGATTTTDLAITRLDDLKARGGYVARLLVDREIPRIPGVTFRRITDALAEARTIRQRPTTQGAGCRITIVVSPGTWVGTTGTADADTEQLPMVIDMPRVTLLGAYEMRASTAGRATGPAGTARASVLIASPALTFAGGNTIATRYSEPMIVVDGDASRGGLDARIEGFVFRSGHVNTTTTGGVGVLSLRVTGLEVVGNSFEGNFTERVDVRSGGALVERNYSAGPGGTCDVCINGPGTTFVVRGNTLVDGGIPGVLIMPSLLLTLPPGLTQVVAPATSNTTVLVDNNDVTGHQSVPVGTAYRIASVGNGAPTVAGSTTVTLTRNRAANNRFGLIVEAGFPVAGTALRGDVTLTTSGNSFEGSCQADLLISLSRHTTGLGLSTLPFLLNSTFSLTLGPELPFANAWFANPAGFGNRLRVNGADVPAGSRVAYDAAKVCS
jgi:hypothetical protein